MGLRHEAEGLDLLPIHDHRVEHMLQHQIPLEFICVGEPGAEVPQVAGEFDRCVGIGHHRLQQFELPLVAVLPAEVLLTRHILSVQEQDFELPEL
jgi:hypothetical protein